MSQAPFHAFLLSTVTQLSAWLLIITYLDIFRRKHASIFDYVQHTHGWQLVEFLEDIKQDLSDLEG